MIIHLGGIVMCMNRKPDPKFDVLSRYAVAILTGQTLAKLAKQEGMTVDQMNDFIKEIGTVNPYLYKQIQDKLGVSDH